MKIYVIIKIISIIVRQFFIPNPFECFGNNAFLINLIAEPIIHFVIFILVRTIYQPGSDPAIGSFLYLLTYSVIIGLLCVLGIFSFAWWWVLVVVVAIVALNYGVIWLKERLFNG